MELSNKQEEIVKKVHDFVKEQSKDSVANGRLEVFKYHILNVKRFAEILADKYPANKFVVIVSAYLHDLYYIQTGNHEVHEIEGAKFAREYLSKFDIPQQEIELIVGCILNHRGSKKSERQKIEEKIIACADAMDHIDRCLGLFYVGHTDFESAVKFMKGKLKRSWEKIELDEAKEIIKPKYEAAKILFSFK
jgi:putative nucleotidyltransferase with HDIG domain